MQTHRSSFTISDGLGFGDRAFSHVERLCSFGTRTAGTEAAELTIGYISDCFAKLGMEVSTDAFEWCPIKLPDRSVTLDGRVLCCRSLYAAQHAIASGRIVGVVTMIHPDAPLDPASCADRILVTDQVNDVLVLKTLKPAAVLVVRSEDRIHFEAVRGRIVLLQVPFERTAAPAIAHNVLGQFASVADRTNRHLVVNAHWDSQGGPGADDNASGVAVLIELARAFAQFAPTACASVKFLATGAEESGQIGALAYTDKYTGSLDSCEVALTIDGVGDGALGEGKPYLAMSPPGIGWERKVDLGSQMRAISSDGGRNAWLCSWDDVYWNSPTVNEDWIDAEVSSALCGDGIDFVKGGCCSGTDERPFAFMGVPTVQQGYSSADTDEVQHSEHDVPMESFRHSLSVSGRVAAQIISVVMQHNCSSRGCTEHR